MVCETHLFHNPRHTEYDHQVEAQVNRSTPGDRFTFVPSSSLAGQ